MRSLTARIVLWQHAVIQATMGCGRKPFCIMVQVAKKADASPQGTDHLYKVLRTCAQWELLIELPGKKFAANAATSALVRDGPPSLGHLAAHQINKPKQQAWQVIPGSCHCCVRRVNSFCALQVFSFLLKGGQIDMLSSCRCSLRLSSQGRLPS